MGVEVTLNTRLLDALLAGWDDAVGHILDKTANDVLAGAQQNIRRNGQIKTGNMLNSGAVEPGDDQWSRYVHFLANYSGFQENGTRYMAGRPFLRPSVEHERLPFQEAFSALGKLHTL